MAFIYHQNLLMYNLACAFTIRLLQKRGVHSDNNKEYNGLVVEWWTCDGGVVGSRLDGGTMLCPKSKQLILSLELFQPRKTRNSLDMTEKK